MMWSPPGYTTRLPVRLEAWSSSVLLLSWVGLGGGPRAPGPIPPPPRVSLYHPQLGSYTLESQEPVQHHLHHQHHRFTALQPCNLYTACIEPPAGTRTCISTITGGDGWRRYKVLQENISFYRRTSGV